MSKLIWLGEVRVLGAMRVGLGAQIGDVAARTYVEHGFQAVFGRQPTLLEAQFAQAVSRGESNYGQACFKNIPAGTTTCNTWNMGAVQCGKLPPCPAGCFEATDHRGPEHGNAAYQACFRQYGSPDEGFTHFIQVLYKQRPTVLAAANTGVISAVSKAMRDSHYFELALDQHIKALTANLKAITTARHEPMPSGGGSASGVAQGAGAGALIGIAALAAGAFYVLTKVVGRAA